MVFNGRYSDQIGREELNIIFDLFVKRGCLKRHPLFWFKKVQFPTENRLKNRSFNLSFNSNPDRNIFINIPTVQTVGDRIKLK